MILGRIIGKTTTNKFQFLAEMGVKKFEYCQVYHKEYGYVLCQVIEIVRTSDAVMAEGNIIGYRDENKVLKIRSPFEIDVEVLKAEEEFVRSVVVGENAGALMGKLEGTGIDVFLDLNKLLTKHLAVLAKTGSGKSYSVGVLLEEIMEKNVPLVIIDPHGEYSSLKKENDKKEDVEHLKAFGMSAKSFRKKIVEYGDCSLDPSLKPITVSGRLTTQELIELFPTKLTNNQLGLLYSTVKDMETITFDNLIYSLQSQENNLKWNIINTLEYLKNLKIFSENPTSYNELVQSGRASIINLRGIEPDVQQMLVYKLLRDLFSERKKGSIPPFFLVLEEAHNFVPEKGFSDAKCSGIIKTIASEGRKFGLGLCVVTQRPAMIQKTVISQCTTQIILKLTNPNDLKAVASSVEGITTEAEDEIRNLPIGTALITGVVDSPLFVNIRPRKTKHGGEAVDILGMQENEKKFMDNLEEFNDQEMLPLIMPNITADDVRIINGDKDVKTCLVPCIMFLCKNRSLEYNLLMEMENGGVIVASDGMSVKTAFLPDLQELTKNELKLLEAAFNLKRFSPVDLISKAGLSFDAKNDLARLVEMGYISLSSDGYEISESYIFTNPAKHAFYGKIEFRNINYTMKHKKKQRTDSLKAKLGRFTNVADLRECFLVRFEL